MVSPVTLLVTLCDPPNLVPDLSIIPELDLVLRMLMDDGGGVLEGG